MNVTFGEIEERMMMTGMHAVCDIFCVGCGSILGWKYVRAPGRDYKPVCESFLIGFTSFVSYIGFYFSGYRP